MAKAKKSIKKTTTDTTSIKKESVVETPVIIEEVKPKAQSYLVAISFEREPVDKDIPVGDLFYHKYSNSFQLQASAPQHMAAVEDIIEGDIASAVLYAKFTEGDISIEEAGSVKMISRAESPVSWITNLHKSREFSGNPFIATEVQEIYEA